MAYDWRELNARAVNVRGYLVCGSPRKLSVGEIILDMHSLNEPTEQPFLVIAPTDAADMLEQWKAVGLDTADMRICDYYYRVTTD